MFSYLFSGDLTEVLAKIILLGAVAIVFGKRIKAHIRMIKEDNEENHTWEKFKTDIHMMREFVKTPEFRKECRKLKEHYMNKLKSFFQNK
ncbi:hypothetical protein [Halobacillus amylolyticus]|uniref:Uncharacterized protein n=1 Tax=Halobacillus amylolyticus TaxID=2932259 RepID=A0ABY4HCP3_9BACI|nr:hypothetical protein [Halobacillus amylolyticus]UOR12622.1 hypothetical protein MUO15_03625 [Halobacillus amylolyticus]